MTFRGNSVNKNEAYQIDYEHIVTPNTYEVIDRFTITNRFKEQDAKKEKYLVTEI